MKRLQHLVPPLLFGLLIYGSIRLVTDSQSRELFWTRSLRQNAIELIFVIGTAYLLNWLLEYALAIFRRRQRSINKRAVLREFALLLIACVMVINPVVILIHFFAQDPISFADIVIANIIILLYLLLYYAVARGNQLLRDYVNQQTQIMTLKSEGLQTELKLLKAQYHPHFLFNALNTIYFQMDEDVPAAKKTLEEFSALLRYQLYDHQQPVKAVEELQHLQNFINLQKMRATDKMVLTVDFDPLLKEQNIYPLLLLPLVENAFKYVGPPYQISIVARLEENWLHFKVCNSTRVQPQPASGGLGLPNLQRRLQLLYPDTHEFSAVPREGEYCAQVKIPCA